VNQNALVAVWPAIVVLWSAAGIASWWFLATCKNAALKRRVFVAIVVAAGFAFTTIVFIGTGGDPRAMLLSVPVVLIISYLNIRLTGFCGACGATLHDSSFHRPRFCSRCGSALESKRV
jgi:hypothetical protein